MAASPAGWLPRVIGHRGAAGHAPENTLAGFRVTRDLGAAWVELDVRLTADGRVVLLHDETLDRTTDGTGLAAALSLDEIAACDAGAWFDERFRGETVPTLEEAIDVLELLGLGANIEIKPAESDIAVASAVCRILDAAWPGALPAPLISSFAVRALEAVRRLAPGLARGLLLDRVDGDWRRVAEGVDAATIHCNHASLTPSRAREIREAGYPVLAYTVNHAGRARELFGWGVAAVFSDRPDRILRDPASGAALPGESLFERDPHI